MCVFIIYNIIVPLSPIKAPFHSELMLEKVFKVKLFNLKNSLENIYQNVDYYYSSNLLFYTKAGFPFGNLKFPKVLENRSSDFLDTQPEFCVRSCGNTTEIN